MERTYAGVEPGRELKMRASRIGALPARARVEHLAGESPFPQA